MREEHVVQDRDVDQFSSRWNLNSHVLVTTISNAWIAQSLTVFQLIKEHKRVKIESWKAPQKRTFLHVIPVSINRRLIICQRCYNGTWFLPHSETRQHLIDPDTWELYAFKVRLIKAEWNANIKTMPGGKKSETKSALEICNNCKSQILRV